jgi:hypothetical protein
LQGAKLVAGGAVTFTHAKGRVLEELSPRYTLQAGRRESHEDHVLHGTAVAGTEVRAALGC